MVIEHRSIKGARRNAAAFATPAKLRCARAAALSRRNRANGNGSRPSTVYFAPGVLPGWLTRAVGQQVQGYHELFVPPFGWPRVYSLLFAYTDRKDPHVVYRVSISVASPTGQTVDGFAYKDLRHEALRLIYALN